jgi:Na+/proline symporter
MTDAASILSAQTGWWLLAIMSVIWVALGLYWGRGGKTLVGHMLAGRNVGLALGAATGVATWVTSNTTMLAPQFALQMGVWGMLAYSTAAIGLFMFAPLAQRIRTLMPQGFTSADFVRRRYGRGAWYVFLAISLFYAFTWLISMGIAGGLLLEALSGIPYRWGMTAILLVCTLYTVVGGLRAVIGTDFIQSSIILIGIVVVAIAVLNAVPLSEIYASVRAERPALLNILMPAALMALFNNLLFGIGEIFHSNVWWSRAFAMREGVGRRAYLIAGCLWLPVPVTAGFIALAAPALGINVPHVNMVGPLVAGELLGAAGAVVVFIVVFASIASSIDSLLAATSDLITKDIVGGILWPRAGDALLRRATTWVTLGLGAIAWLVCSVEDADLGSVLFRAGPLVGSTIWPLLAGLYWRRTNPASAVGAMVAGTATGLYAYYAVGWYTAALVGTFVSMCVLVVWTLAAPRSFDWGSLQRREAA